MGCRICCKLFAGGGSGFIILCKCLPFEGDEENIEKFNRRLVKVTKQHNDDCKQLLKLMGIPYVEVGVITVTF